VLLVGDETQLGDSEQGVREVVQAAAHDRHVFALLAVGGYVFALTTLNWQTVPILGFPMNGLWAMGFAAIGGVVFGLLIGFLGARLRGPYLAGLTLGIAVGIPAIANRFPELLGGETGLQLTVPYPDGGYAPVDETLDEQFTEELPTEQEALPSDLKALRLPSRISRPRRRYSSEPVACQ
jgi:hypothetical protein